MFIAPATASANQSPAVPPTTCPAHIKSAVNDASNINVFKRFIDSFSVP
jgi:hypothetical protein